MYYSKESSMPAWRIRIKMSKIIRLSHKVLDGKDRRTFTFPTYSHFKKGDMNVLEAKAANSG